MVKADYELRARACHSMARILIRIDIALVVCACAVIVCACTLATATCYACARAKNRHIYKPHYLCTDANPAPILAATPNAHAHKRARQRSKPTSVEIIEAGQFVLARAQLAMIDFCRAVIISCLAGQLAGWQASLARTILHARTHARTRLSCERLESSTFVAIASDESGSMRTPDRPLIMRPAFARDCSWICTCARSTNNIIIS